tara:strand:+ start:84 stop:554 length:471 start_codon:yes stop_codon:yes gene_type:complete
MSLKRKTKLSECVLRILEVNRQPLSIQQILEILKSESLSPNKTTLYRMMDKLIESKVVTQISRSNGISYYELIKLKSKNSKQNHSHHHHHHHHHHFFCNNCDLVVCLDGCVVEMNKIDLSSFLPNKSFEVHSHDFNIYGICGNCKNNKENKGIQVV